MSFREKENFQKEGKSCYNQIILTESYSTVINLVFS
jgi:hypothetical protein